MRVPPPKTKNQTPFSQLSTFLIIKAQMKKKNNNKKAYLEVRAIDTPRQLHKQRLHNLDKLIMLNHIQNLLHLIQEHDFLWRINLGPVPQQTQHDFFCESRILFEELDDTVCELGVIECEGFSLVQGNESASKKGLVFLFKRESETVDDRAEDFEQLGNTVMSFRFVNKLEKDMAYRAADECS